jgi:hypothetical protein
MVEDEIKAMYTENRKVFSDSLKAFAPVIKKER